MHRVLHNQEDILHYLDPRIEQYVFACKGDIDLNNRVDPTFLYFDTLNRVGNMVRSYEREHNMTFDRVMFVRHDTRLILRQLPVTS